MLFVKIWFKLNLIFKFQFTMPFFIEMNNIHAVDCETKQTSIKRITWFHPFQIAIVFICKTNTYYFPIFYFKHITSSTLLPALLWFYCIFLFQFLLFIIILFYLNLKRNCLGKSSGALIPLQIYNIFDKVNAISSIKNHLGKFLSSFEKYNSIVKVLNDWNHDCFFFNCFSNYSIPKSIIEIVFGSLNSIWIKWIKLVF